MFSKEVKEKALFDAQFKCERCGKPKAECRGGYLHIHHCLAVSAAIHHYPQIAPSIVASLANTMVLCDECHPIMDELAQENHAFYAQALLAISREAYTGGSIK